MTNKLQYMIEQILEEQWGAITSRQVFGKDRNGGNENPNVPQWNVQNGSSKAQEYHQKLQNLEPTIRQTQQYQLFLRDVGNTNPDDESSLFGMYENFLRYFSINKDDFQDGDDDDWAAAKAVAEYFEYIPDRIQDEFIF